MRIIFWPEIKAIIHLPIFNIERYENLINLFKFLILWLGQLRLLFAKLDLPPHVFRDVS